MLSPARSSILSNARTLLLNRHFFFLNRHEQRGLRTKNKNSDATPHNSSSGDEDNKSEQDTGPNGFRRVSFGVHKMSLEEFKLYKEKEFKQILRDKNPNITDEEIDKIVAKSKRKVRVIQINVSYVRYVFWGIVAYLAYVTFTKLKNAPSKTGSHSTWNEPSPPAYESDLEKKELKTGNEFDLNALFPTAVDDSGKQPGYQR
ncbi:hypothetical protein Ddc_15399 [Ditylenchus destructor]|nr:hypothetical protein Ddc_15399 [Ditylenchus destructor]